MAKAFSVASWNIKHFGASDKKKEKPKKALEPIIRFLQDNEADIMALFEVRSKIVFRPLVKAFPHHQFHITEGPQTQEILVGIRRTLNAFITQKLAFKSGQPQLRPGVLVTPHIDGQFYPILFLHLKSMTDPKGFGLRDDMMRRAYDFRKKLNAASGNGRANYIFAGDLNTMGLDYIRANKDISGAEEIRELARRGRYKDMTVLEKNYDATYLNISKSNVETMSNIDHVVAANHLTFKRFKGKPVDVRGWPQEETLAQRKAWINTYSDHPLLYFEVQQVL